MSRPFFPAGHRVWVLGLYLFAVGAMAQRDNLALHYATGITEADLERHLKVLASDAFEGRETGHPGEDMAGDYLVEQFRSFGIPEVPDWGTHGMLDGYRQPFTLEQRDPSVLGMEIGGRPLLFAREYVGISEGLRKDRATKDLWIMRPEATNAVVPAVVPEVALVLGAMDPKGTDPFEVLRTATNLRERFAGNGPKVVLLVADRFEDLMARMGHTFTARRMRLEQGDKPARPALQLVLITQAVADRILAQAGTNVKKARKRSSKGSVVLQSPLQFTYRSGADEVRGENILAYIEGGDRKEEVVVVTAHYDHIGIIDGEVHNGADDDGSGTVALLEIAQALAKAKAEGNGLRRSVLVMAVSGEEKGLLGSAYYADHPVFPLDLTVADVNIDMIGRVDTIHTNGAPYIYVIGSDRLSTGLHVANERANRYAGLELDYRYNSADDPNRFYYRSDHYNFAKKGVPSVFYFSGVHEDYHGPGDDVEKIRFDLVRQRTLLVFHTIWDLADRPERIVVDRPEGR